MKKKITYLSISIIVLCLYFHQALTNHLDQYFPITKIQVEAPFIYANKQDIESKITKYTQGGLIGVDNTKLINALNRIPLVKQADVKKIWPGTLFIKIHERRPLATFNNSILLDEFGEPFPNTNIVTENLAKLVGAKGSEKELLHEYQKVSRLLINISLTLKTLKIKASTITLIMDDGLKVLLSKKGSKEQLARFIQVYPELTHKKSTPVLRVDMRYKHGLAVKW